MPRQARDAGLPIFGGEIASLRAKGEKLLARGEAGAAKGRGSSSRAGNPGGASASYYRYQSMILAGTWYIKAAEALEQGNQSEANAAIRTAQTQEGYSR